MDKKYTTVYCLSAITVVGMITGFAGIAFLLWAGYGIYKLLQED